MRGLCLSWLVLALACSTPSAALAYGALRAPRQLRARAALPRLQAEGGGGGTPDGAAPEPPAVVSPVGAAPEAEPVAPGAVATAAELEEMDFDARLAQLASQVQDVAPAPKEEPLPFGVDKFLGGSNTPKDDDPAGKFYKLEFWKLVWEDLQLMVWPTPKKVAQTFVISQTAFVTVVVLVLLIDALAETTVRAPPPAPPRAPAPELTARTTRRRSRRCARCSRAPTSRSPWTCCSRRARCRTLGSRSSYTVVDLIFNTRTAAAQTARGRGRAGRR